MNFINFFKQKWNMVITVSASVALMLSKFVDPPNFSNILAQGQNVDYASFAKFLIAGIVLLMLVPFNYFQQKKHAPVWWVAAIISFGVGLFLFFNYNDIKNKNAALNKDSQNWEVIGVHLLPNAKKAVDSVKKLRKVDSIPAGDILTNNGSAEDNWPLPEISVNANAILRAYIYTVAVFTLFLLFALQALYCQSSKKSDPV